VSGSGLLGSSTGADGCAIANVVTSGLGASAEGAPSGVLTFGLGGLTATVDIIVNLATLQVSPSFVLVPSGGTNFNITIAARDTGGNAVSGVNVSGACTVQGSATIDPAAFGGVTNASGRTVHSGTADGFTDASTPPVQTGS